MKGRAFRYLPLWVFFLTACDSAASRNPVETITFDSEKRLDEFGFAASGNGNPGEWVIVDNDAGRALAPMDTQAAADRLSFAIYRPLSGQDVYVSTRFMIVSGEIDQAAGVFVRFKSPDDYYAARADALENNVSLYRIAAGRREMIGRMEVNVSNQVWHTLG